MAGVFARWRNLFQFAAHKLHVKPLARDLFTRLAEKLTTSEDAEKLYFWHEECRATAAAVTELLQKMGTEVVVGDRYAYQFIQITAAMLESSDDPDGNPVARSVLITDGRLQSDHQFNWMQSGGVRRSKVVFGPGDGSASHAVIIDRDDANIRMAKLEAQPGSAVLASSSVVKPYGMTGLKLQIGEWRANDAGAWEFWPSSIAVGTWVYLEQELPMKDF